MSASRLLRVEYYMGDHITEIFHEWKDEKTIGLANGQPQTERQHQKVIFNRLCASIDTYAKYKYVFLSWKCFEDRSIYAETDGRTDRRSKCTYCNFSIYRVRTNVNDNLQEKTKMKGQYSRNTLHSIMKEYTLTVLVYHDHVI